MISAVSVREIERRGLATCVAGDPRAEFRGARHDSRDVRAGELFGALGGDRVIRDAHVETATARGASVILTDHVPARPHAHSALYARPSLLVSDDCRESFGALAHLTYGEPTASLEVLAVTGTNGKTTTTYLLEEALRSLGATPAVLGTIEARGPQTSMPAKLTTPEADDIARFAARVLRTGATHLAMEASSHSLVLSRLSGTHVGCAIFTNLTQDHLDFHGTMDAYFEAKAKLFTLHRPRVSIINVDDSYGRALADRVTGQRLTFSAKGADADISASDHTIDSNGTRATIKTPSGKLELRSPLIGFHNLENLLAALGALIGCGASAADAVRALGNATGARGRLQRVEVTADSDLETPYGAVYVDYAHTPDALARALEAVRGATVQQGDVIAVFGCGGDRDRLKRPLMGAAAALHADRCIVTSDNPRNESPEAIIDEVVPALRDGGLTEFRSVYLEPLPRARVYARISDRAEAIELAIRSSRPGDVVLIAGKGHETYQQLATTTRYFDDSVVAAEAMVALRRSPDRTAS